VCSVAQACTNIWTHTYISTYEYTYVHVYIHIYVYTFMYIHIYVHIYVYICICIYIYISVHVYTYIRIYILIYIHMFTYVHMYIYIHIYRVVCSVARAGRVWWKQNVCVSKRHLSLRSYFGRAIRGSQMHRPAKGAFLKISKHSSRDKLIFCVVFLRCFLCLFFSFAAFPLDFVSACVFFWVLCLVWFLATLFFPERGVGFKLHDS